MLKIWSGVRKEPQDQPPLPSSMLVVRLQLVCENHRISWAGNDPQGSPKSMSWSSHFFPHWAAACGCQWPQITKIHPQRAGSAWAHTLWCSSSSPWKAHHSKRTACSPASQLGQDWGVSSTTKPLWLRNPQLQPPREAPRHWIFSDPIHNTPKEGTFWIIQLLTVCS